jgi:6-pyruvoyltetrahydropterin/6-carboxytetrahydropterin synthase
VGRPVFTAHAEEWRPATVVSSPPSKGTIKSAKLLQVAAGLGGFMYEVTVEDTFAAGHYLRNYKGKCENPHGHNYKVRVTLTGGELDKAGLLVDFKDLKDVMKQVIDRLDHRMINDLEPFTVLNPSAENLAKYFYNETNTRLRGMTSGRVQVKDVTIFETDTTTARYSE